MASTRLFLIPLPRWRGHVESVLRGLKIISVTERPGVKRENYERLQTNNSKSGKKVRRCMVCAADVTSDTLVKGLTIQPPGA